MSERPPEGEDRVLTEGVKICTLKNRYMLFRDAEDMAVCLVTAEVVRAAVRLLEDDGLRPLDALHLGTALEWGAELFVTADRRQAAAARRAGMAVLNV
jgi:predicted nucleic acid-binding protein